MNKLWYWILSLFGYSEYARLGGLSRSPLWPKVRKEHLQKNPSCVACDKKENLAVHHKLPFHLYPELELSPKNLLTLCEGNVVNCHFLWGHCFLSWRCYNKTVDTDVLIIDNLRKCAKTEKEIEVIGH